MRKNIKTLKNNFHIYTALNKQEFDKIAFEKFLSLTKGFNKKLIFLPTGNTPLGFYKKFCEYYLSNKLLLNKFFFINLDEYLEINQTNKISFKKYLDNNLVKPLGLKSKHYYWINNQKPISQEKAKILNIIKKHKCISLCVLGIGENGHIAFNEPNCDPKLDFYDTKLSQSTQKNITFSKKPIINGRTIGIKKILSSKKILVLVSINKKKRPLKKLLSKKIDPIYPVTYLSQHKNVTIVVKE